MSIADDITRILSTFVEDIHQGNTTRAAEALGVNPPTLWRWLKGENVPKVQSLVSVFEAMGVKLVMPGDMEKTEDIEVSKLREELVEAKKELMRKQGEIDALERRLDKQLGIQGASSSMSHPKEGEILSASNS